MCERGPPEWQHAALLAWGLHSPPAEEVPRHGDEPLAPGLSTTDSVQGCLRHHQRQACAPVRTALHTRTTARRQPTTAQHDPADTLAPS
eukprot:2785202-Rhodomonas_salina.1